MLSNPHVIRKLQKRTDCQTKQIGPYAIVRINRKAIPLITALEKNVQSSNKNLANFKQEQYQLYRKQESFLNIEPVRGLSLTTEQTSKKMKPLLSWSDDYQSITLINLIPKKLYRLNYTYLPKWKIRGGQLYQGQSDRMIIYPESETVTLTYE